MRTKTKISIILIIICSFFTAAAEFFWKLGSADVNGIYSIIFNLNIILGFVLYALSFVLLSFALSKSRLSTIYPFLSLSFVWAFLISVFILGELVYLSKIIGVMVIIIGVILLGYGDGR